MQKIHEKTEIKVSELVAFAGVSKSTWHEWKSRKGIETRHNHETPKLNWYTPEERMAVVKYVLAHKNFLYGYRYLAWQMIDENVAFVRPASVYNIMKEYDLVHKWAKNEGEAKKKGFDQPSAPNELSTKCDAYRYFIHQGSWCVLLFSLLELYETSARICHPQSNGKLERFHSTLKTEHVRKTPYFGYEDAKEKMAQWIDFYNNGRLHGALLYLTPEDYFAGRKEVRLAERKEKLHTADINRKAYWLQQQHS